MIDRENLITAAKMLFDGTARNDNPEYLRGMCELIAECYGIEGVPAGDAAEMVEAEILDKFDRDKLYDFVTAHGYGSPTEEGYFDGWNLIKNGDDYATAAFEVVARGLTQTS